MDSELEEFDYYINKYYEIKDKYPNKDYESIRKRYLETKEIVGNKRIEYKIKISDLLDEIKNNKNINIGQIDYILEIISPTTIKGNFINIDNFLYKAIEYYGDSFLESINLKLNIISNNIDDIISIIWHRPLIDLLEEKQLLDEISLYSYKNLIDEDYTKLIFTGDINSVFINCTVDNLLFENIVFNHEYYDEILKCLINVIRKELQSKDNKKLVK